jgi:predicted dehydrogenase
MPIDIKLGFIGGGPRANSLWQTICSIPDFEDSVLPYAMLDKDLETAKNWAFRVDKTFTDLDGLLKSEVDAVIIGTPPHTHAPIATKCLKAGISVWSEVPMGLTMEEIWGIIDADKGNKGTRGHYFFGENYCYNLTPQFMANQHYEGKIGDIYYSEGEYSHSVEHYMIEENFIHRKEIDPEITEHVTPTWRADLTPIKYGHAFGPCLYVLNKNKQNIIERPAEVSGMGNMKMQKRFNTDNFQIATVKTDQDTIIKFVTAFVLGSHGRVFYSFWGSRGLFMGGSFQSDGKHYYYEVPPEKAAYPYRHQEQPQILSEEDLKTMGTPSAAGGHGGADTLMFHSWLDSLVNGKPLEIDVFRGAEMSGTLILAAEAIQKHKTVEIPKFE